MCEAARVLLLRPHSGNKNNEIDGILNSDYDISLKQEVPGSNAGIVSNFLFCVHAVFTLRK